MDVGRSSTEWRKEVAALIASLREISTMDLDPASTNRTGMLPHDRISLARLLLRIKVCTPADPSSDTNCDGVRSLVPVDTSFGPSMGNICPSSKPSSLPVGTLDRRATPPHQPFPSSNVTSERMTYQHTTDSKDTTQSKNPLIRPLKLDQQRLLWLLRHHRLGRRELRRRVGKGGERRVRGLVRLCRRRIVRDLLV